MPDTRRHQVLVRPAKDLGADYLHVPISGADSYTCRSPEQAPTRTELGCGACHASFLAHRVGEQQLLARHAAAHRH